jgi:hypothetical protein
MGFLNWLKDKEKKVGNFVTTSPKLKFIDKAAESAPVRIGNQVGMGVIKAGNEAFNLYNKSQLYTNPASLIPSVRKTMKQESPVVTSVNKFVNANPAKTTGEKVARFVGENAPAMLLPASKGFEATKIASPVKRLVANTLLRGGENAAYNTGTRLARNEKVTPKDIATDFAIGSVANVAFSPKQVVNSIKYKSAISKMDRTIPIKYSKIQETGNLYKPDIKEEVIPISKFEQEVTGHKVAINLMGEKGVVNKKIDKNTGKLISWETDSPEFAQRMQTGDVQFGLSTREVKPSEIPLENGRIPIKTSQVNPQKTLPTIEETGLSQPSQITTPTTQVDTSFDVNSYINKQKVAQKASEGKIGIKGKLGSVLSEVKTKLVDSNAPIEDILTKAEKEGKFNVVPTKDIRYQIDRVLRSDSLATQALKDSGIDKVIREVDDVDALNQYLIAKQAQDVAGKGIKTGRNLAEDQGFIGAVADKYEPFAQQIYTHNRKMLDTLVDSGMISRELSDQLKREYPNYVPLNRIFSEAEQSTMAGMGKSSAVASVGTQKVVKRLKGSERDIENPLESILTKTSQVFEQAEKNKAATMLAGYKDLPGNPFSLEEVIGSKSPGESTISFFDNGAKRVFKTDPEIANAAKNMSQQQIGLLGQIFAIPTRLLKLGATGLNLPFVASNLAKDQVFATINSTRALSTSLANPVNFGKALFETLKQGKLYDDWQRSGSSFTSWDMQRNASKPTVEALRAGKDAGSRVLYTVKHPQSFIKTLEDAIGKSEEVTRIQQFNGMRDKLVSEGRTLEDATILAANASRNDTTNFARRGEWGTVINSAIPYINAGIQGSRTLVTSLKTRPVQTTFKIAGLVFTPLAMATAWNLKDPKRKEAYNDIPEYEKDGNIIIIPENPVKDANGRWNAIKIPMTPGVSNLASILRRQIEGVDNFDTESFARVSGDLLTAGTSINPVQTDKLIAQLTPQALKPGIESFTNKNLFTGLPIVPDSMKDLPAEEQVKTNTSGTARIIGGMTGSSPLKVENAIRTAGGGVGQQLLNASDKTLAKSGVIPEEQIGGKSVTDSFANRFTSVAGGQNESKVWDQISQQEEAKKKENKDRISRYLSGDKTAFNGLTSQQKSALISSAKEKEATADLTSLEKTIFNMSKENKLQLAQSKPEMTNTIQDMTNLKDSLSTTKTSFPKVKISKAKGKSKRIKVTKYSAPKPKKIKVIKVAKVKAKKYKFKKARV